MDNFTNSVKSLFKKNISYKEFINAIRFNDIDTVREYLKQDNPETIAEKINTSKEYNTPINIAAEEGHVEIAELLLKAGANPNIQNNKGNTALLTAIKNNHLDIAEIILSKMMHEERFKNGINLQNAEGLTALNMAVLNKHNPIMNNLITAGADVDTPDLKGNTPLINAITSGSFEIANYLLDNKADPNIFTRSGNALFSVVSFIKFISSTSILFRTANPIRTTFEKIINYGADIDVIDANGNTPLILLVALVKNLESPINENEGMKRTTALIRRVNIPATRENILQMLINNTKIVGTLLRLIRLLLEAGCDTSIRNHKCETAALINKNPIIADMLNGDNDLSIAAQHEKLIKKAKRTLNINNGKKIPEESKIKNNQKVIDDLMNGTLQSLRLVKDNLNNIDNINKFAGVASELSDIIAILGLHLDDDKQIIFDKAANSTRKVAAVIGDETAKRIVQNFANDDDEAPRKGMLFTPKRLPSKNDERYEEHKSISSPKPIG